MMLTQALSPFDLEGVLGREPGNLSSPTRSSGWEGPPQGHLLVISGMRDRKLLFHSSVLCRHCSWGVHSGLPKTISTIFPNDFYS